MIFLLTFLLYFRGSFYSKIRGLMLSKLKIRICLLFDIQL